MSRERDIRIGIKDLADATAEFDLVWFGGPDDPSAMGASDQRGLAIEPYHTADDARNEQFDAAPGGVLIFDCKVYLHLISRHEVSQVRDETAERLLNLVRNAVGGQSLGGLTFAQDTRVSSWNWVKAQPPERQIKAVLACKYDEEGWQAADTTE